jgi:glycosyltransferase involved in cell wall biosynthesis
MKISIIIPTLNEVAKIYATINAIRLAAQYPSGRFLPIEIIVVDGGSSDNTVEVAKQWADKTIITIAGRGLQMNAGATISTGELLVFLHADTLLRPKSLLRLRNLMHDPTIIGGGFSKDWKWSSSINLTAFLKFSTWFWQGFGNWLVYLFRIFPGDNAIFIRKSIFLELKGFKNFWICEDLDIFYRLHEYVRRDHNKYQAIIYLHIPVLTSTRRFEEYGFFRIWIWWICIFFLWRFGWSQNRLKQFTTKYLYHTRWLFQKRGNVLLI